MFSVVKSCLMITKLLSFNCEKHNLLIFCNQLGSLSLDDKGAFLTKVRLTSPCWILKSLWAPGLEGWLFATWRHSRGELGRELYRRAASQPKSFLKHTKLRASSPPQREDKTSACAILFLLDLEPCIDLGRVGEAPRLHSSEETDQRCPVRKEFFGTVETGEGLCGSSCREKVKLQAKKALKRDSFDVFLICYFMELSFE